MTGTAQYGGKYWCVKTEKTLSSDGEIYVMGDRMEVTGNGDLIVWGGFRNSQQLPPPEPMLVVAAGQWMAAFQVSVMDGAAVAVEHWKGEIIRDSA